MSDTPRTDAQMTGNSETTTEEYNELADFARQLETELTAERELRIMQLAGVSTASIQNTETTIKDRIDSSNPYYSTAYHDTCVAVDREMKLRVERDQLKKELEFISLNHCGVKVEGEITHADVYAFVEGQIDKQSDRADKVEAQLAVMTKERDELKTQIRGAHDFADGFTREITRQQNKLEAMTKAAEGLADALQFCEDYKKENCNGQIGWRDPKLDHAIAGEVRVKHIIKAEQALAEFERVRKEINL